ncbi:hypothetical protein AAFP35_03455 [Gordonia sp. CPCC 206044]|uniref:aspartate racemase/maleate isomerase family protein n=1 Tax=Gordonia sp. CPCC 206044 TaxID=3140793 RepID=UPI003AF3635A
MIRARIGFVVPSSNPTMERLFNSTGLLAALGISAVCTRVSVRAMDEAAVAEPQFTASNLADAAELLGECECDLITWAGTTGFWLSEAADDEIVSAMAERTGVPATSTHRAVLAALDDVGARRIGLYTPNSAALHQRVLDHLSRKGFGIDADAQGGITRNLDFAKIPQSELDATINELAGAEGRPVAVVSTNVSTAVECAVDSAIATVWQAACLAGATTTYRQAHRAARDE